MNRRGFFKSIAAVAAGIMSCAATENLGEEKSSIDNNEYIVVSSDSSYVNKGTLVYHDDYFYYVNGYAVGYKENDSSTCSNDIYLNVNVI